MKNKKEAVFKQLPELIEQAVFRRRDSAKALWVSKMPFLSEPEHLIFEHPLFTDREPARQPCILCSHLIKEHEVMNRSLPVTGFQVMFH